MWTSTANQLDYECKTQLVSVASPFLRARAAQEAGRRILWMEPSTEHVDTMGDVVVQDALRASAEHFLKFGNIDIDHLSMIGHKLGLNPREWEIGRPIDVDTKRKRIAVRAEVYRGHEKADWFWATLTKQVPPMVWYPSVGGLMPQRENNRVVKLLWVNIGLSRTPVNQHVEPVKLSPTEFARAVTAGYGTDSAQLTGGAALRRQSLAGAPLAVQVQPFVQYLLKVRHGRVRPCEHLVGPWTEMALKACLERDWGIPPEAGYPLVIQFLGGGV
jgi:hypothetical protein